MKKITVGLLVPITLILTGLRVYQLLCLTESGTGFLSAFDWSGYVFYILLGVGALALMLVAALPRQRNTETSLGGSGSLGRGAAALLAGLAIVAENVLSVLRLLEDRTAEAWGWQLALAAFGLITAMYLLGLGVTLCRHREPRCFPILALLPAAWLAARAMLTYLLARVAITVPAIVLSILLMVFVAVWWMAHARLHGGVDTPKGQRSIQALTPVCLMLIVVSVLPAAIGALIVGSEVSPVSFADITNAVMAPYILLTALPRTPLSVPEAEAPAAPEPPEFPEREQ